MDASHTLSKTALILAAMSVAASATTGTLTVTPNSTTTNVQIRVSQPTYFTVSGGSGVYTTTTTVSDGPSGWFNVSGQSGAGAFHASMAPISNTSCYYPATQSCTGTITFTDTVTPGLTATVTVTNANTGNTGDSGGSGGGGGGGGTGGQFYADKGNLTLVAGTSTTVALNNATTGTVSYNIVSTQPSWLGASQQGTSNQGCSPTGGATYCLAANGSVTLTIGALTGANGFGQVHINPVDSTPPVYINVTIGSGTVTGSLIPSPSSISFSYPGVTSQYVKVTSNSQLTFSVSTTASWLSFNAQSGLTSDSTVPIQGQLYVALNNAATTLGTGTYNGSITLIPQANPSDVTIIPVTLSVNGGGGTSTSLAAPTALAFACQSTAGTTTCGAPYQTVIVNDSGTPTVSTSDNSGWPSTCNLGASYAGGQKILVSLSCSGTVAADSYTGVVAVTSSQGITQSIPVTVTVTSDATLLGNVSNSGGDATCVATAGVCSTNVFLSLTSSASATPLTVDSATPSASWVKLGACTGTTQLNCVLDLDPSSLPNGFNTANIVVDWSVGSGGTLAIPVAVLVSGSNNSGSLTTTTSLSFSTANLTTQSFVMNGAGASTYSITTQTFNCGSNWLSVSPTGSGSFNGSPVTVQTSIVAGSVTPGSLTQCTGQINLSADSGVTQTIPVTLTVGGSGGNITVTAGSSAGGATVSALSFTGQAGGSTTAAQAIYIASSASGSAAIPFSVSTSPAGSWLQVSAAQGQTPTSINVSAIPGQLAASGTPYSGTITITPTGGSAYSIPVSFTVTSASTVSATSTPLSFTYTAGNTSPTPSFGTITVSGTAAAQFTATASSTGDWLSVTPTSAAVPQSGSLPLAVSLQNLSSLTVSPTPYTGTITVAGSGGTVGSTVINVSLTVSAPLPTIITVQNAASNNTGPLAAGEAIAIMGTELGPVTPALLTADMIAGGSVPLNLGGVTVTVGGYNAPVLYASSTQVNAIVPYEINTPVYRQSVPVVVKFLGQGSNGYSEMQVPAAPGIFSLDSSGTGPAVIIDPELSNPYVSAANPANKGDIVAMYVTGEGQTLPAGKTGAVIPVSTTYPKSIQPPVVTINGQPARVDFYGEAPDSAGVLQINLQIPPNAASGNLPVVVSFGGVSSQLTSTGVGAVSVAVK